MTIRRGWKTAAIVGTVALVVALGALLPVREWIVGLGTDLRGMGARGVLLFAVVYVVSEVALVPGSLLALAAGFAYGPIGGVLIVSPASVAAATVAFLLGRTLLRGWVTRKASHSPALRALDQAAGRHGLKLILLLRLSPVIPFNLLNYALGASGASIRQYVVASFVGMLPGTFLYVYLGSLATTAANLNTAGEAGGTPSVVLSGIGLAATILVVVLATRWARRALQKELKMGQ